MSTEIEKAASQFVKSLPKKNIKMPKIEAAPDAKYLEKMREKEFETMMESEEIKKTLDRQTLSPLERIVYLCTPIDIKLGLFGVEEFLLQEDEYPSCDRSFSHEFARAAYALAIAYPGCGRARFDSGARYGWYAYALPYAPSLNGCTFASSFVFVFKEDNNGTTYHISPKDLGPGDASYFPEKIVSLPF